jgi:hypothetical protein
MPVQSAEPIPQPWRWRLENIQKRLQRAMQELVDEKNYTEAERLLRNVDTLMLSLIEDAGGLVVRSD